MGLGRFGLGVARAIVAGYPLALAIVAILLHFVGESHWTTTVGLYLPAVFYLAPLVLVVPLALRLRPRAWLSAPALGAFLAVFPLMGGVCSPLSLLRGSSREQVRVLSYNVNNAWGGGLAVAERIAEHDPDIVLLQELDFQKDELLASLRAKYATVEESTQFVLATRYPLKETELPPKIPFGGRQRSPRYLRYVVETPLGPWVVYNVHPLSPREGLGAVRGAGLRSEIASGRLLRGESSQVVADNTDLRVLQIEHVATSVRRETLPVLVAGDLNLPSPSPLLRRQLGSLRDGFASVGNGFGYTFPTKFPFLRLDRILVGEQLRVVQFEVGCGKVSDHYCVVARIARD